MKRLLGFSFLLSLTLMTGDARAQDVLGIAAVVNDKVISVYDLGLRLSLVTVLTGLPNTPETRNRLAPQVLQTLIEDQLKRQEAARLKITANDKAVQATLRNLEKDNKLAKGGLKDYLAQRGVEQKTMIDQIKTNQVWRRLVNFRFGSKVIITDEEIAKTQSVRDRVASIQSDVARWEKQIKELPKEIAALETSLKQHDKKSTSEDRPVDPISTEKETTVANVDADVDDNDSEFDPDKVRQRVDEATKQIEEAKRAVAAAKPEIMRLKKTPGFEIPVANALTEEQVRVEEITAEKMKIVYYANKPRDLNVFVRGDARRLGVVVHREIGRAHV